MHVLLIRTTWKQAASVRATLADSARAAGHEIALFSEVVEPEHSEESLVPRNSFFGDESASESIWNCCEGGWAIRYHKGAIAPRVSMPIAVDATDDWAHNAFSVA